MMSIPESVSKAAVEKLLQYTDIKIDGPQPWDIKVNNPKFYQRIIRQQGLGLGESYMDKWWDCERLDIFFDKILSAKLDEKIKYPFLFHIRQLFPRFLNLQNKIKSKEVIKKHYDLGNKLYQSMLDKKLVYSCGYWRNANNLDAAQEEKLDLICKKLYLKPGLTLLDIGCGFGSLAKFAAENYRVNVTGITLSQNQFRYAVEYCQNTTATIYLRDYRDVKDQYDRIVSVGMFEHVGHLNYRTFMQVAHRSLKEGGLFLLHTIGSPITWYYANEWIDEYIFPNSMIPSLVQIGKAIEGLFIMEDWHNFGADYDKTLMAWYENFINHWQELKSDYDERFYRMWTYYLLSCAGSFRARSNQLWQVVLSKEGVRGGYVSIR